MKNFFITGIDTDAGKSIATGLISRFLLQKNYNVITAKLTQTGCNDIAEDIITHRRLEGRELLDLDKKHKTCPYVFKMPCSPHLAAEQEQQTIAPERITELIDTLNSQHDYVLVEGAGGLFVPLTRSLMTIELVAQQDWPLILVSSGRLGSINHTLLSIEAALSRGMALAGIVYNAYPEENKTIYHDSRRVIKEWLEQQKLAVPIIDIPLIDDLETAPNIDFGAFWEANQWQM